MKKILDNLTSFAVGIIFAIAILFLLDINREGVLPCITSEMN